MKTLAIGRPGDKKNHTLFEAALSLSAENIAAALEPNTLYDDKSKFIAAALVAMAEEDEPCK